MESGSAEKGWSAPSCCSDELQLIESPELSAELVTSLSVLSFEATQALSGESSLLFSYAPPAIAFSPLYNASPPMREATPLYQLKRSYLI